MKQKYIFGFILSLIIVSAINFGNLSAQATQPEFIIQEVPTDKLVIDPEQQGIVMGKLEKILEQGTTKILVQYHDRYQRGDRIHIGNELITIKSVDDGFLQIWERGGISETYLEGETLVWYPSPRQAKKELIAKQP